MSNFIPNETKRFVPRDPPWITKPLKTMLNRKNRLYKSYERHGYKDEDKVKLDSFRIECQEAVNNAKLTYLTNMGNKVTEPNTSQKTYWKIINQIMNKCRAPKIPLNFLTNKKIDQVTVENEEILSLVRNLNPNKSTGSDGISGKMLLLCDDSVCLPHQIIFKNILSSSIYPDMWKLANVTPIFKKGDKQLIIKYRPISLLPICGKIFENLVFYHLYS